MNNNQYAQRVNMNRFGEAEILVTAKQVIDKKSGESLPIFKAYAEINGSLYKLEISNRNKELKDGGEGKWLKITKKKKQSQSQQTRF